MPWRSALIFIAMAFTASVAAATDRLLLAEPAASTQRAPKPPCPAGYINVAGKEAGQRVCQACKVGFMSTKINAASCTKCPAAGYGGGPKCGKCEIGYYSTGNTTAECQRCSPRRYTTQRQGSTSARACSVCAPGFGDASLGCRACPTGFWSAWGTTEQCKLCSCPRLPCKTPTCSPKNGTCTGHIVGYLNYTSCVTTDTQQPGKCTADGVCDPDLVCRPLTCQSAQYLTKCGLQLDDGCGGKLDCVCRNYTDTCKPGDGLGPGTCVSCIPRRCTDADLVGKCVVNLENGCGGKLTCRCDPDSFTSLVCSTDADAKIGDCLCQPRQCGVDYNCGVLLDNGCGGSVNCSCNSSNSSVCSTSIPGDSSGVCKACAAKTCADFVEYGQCGVFDDGCGGRITCGCQEYGWSCFWETGPWDSRVESQDVNEVVECVCTAPLHCDQGKYAGKCGNALPNACGITFNCPCNGTDVCSTGGAKGVVGSCKQSGCAGHFCWSPQYEGRCGTALDDGCGAVMDCGCPEGQLCSEATPGLLGICYLQDCPPSIGGATCSKVANIGWGWCGFNFASGCPGVPLNCPCANPSQICRVTEDGVLGTCQAPRGTDGACKEVPDIPSSINNTDTAAVTNLVTSNYLPYLSCFLNGYTDASCCNLDAGFPGGINNCMGNSISHGWQEETRRMINLFRVMAGLPHVQFTNSTRANLAKQAALVLAANQILTSDPPSTSSCYSQAALFGSWMSNLAFGHTGADAVVWYMAGFGNGRARAKLLHPINQNMATGDCFPEAMHIKQPTNALWVVEDNKDVNWAIPITSGPAAARQFVSWPPPGFVPHIMVYPDWHIQTGGFSGTADTTDYLANATVSIRHAGLPVAVELVIKEPNFIVFAPAIGGLQGQGSWRTTWIRHFPAAELTYSVSISGLSASKFGSTSISYDVTIYKLPGFVPPL